VKAQHRLPSSRQGRERSSSGSVLCLVAATTTVAGRLGAIAYGLAAIGPGVGIGLVFGHSIEAFAYAAVAVDLAREQLAASGWQPGNPVPWRTEPNRAYLRALDAQRRAALALGLDGHAGRLADELASADAEAPARIASEFTPTQLMPIVASTAIITPATEFEARTGEPLAEPTAAVDAAGED